MINIADIDILYLIFKLPSFLQNFPSEKCLVSLTIFKCINASNTSDVFSKHSFLSIIYANNPHLAVFWHLLWQFSAKPGFLSLSTMSFIFFFEPMVKPIVCTLWSKQWPSKNRRIRLSIHVKMANEITILWWILKNGYLDSFGKPPKSTLLARWSPLQQLDNILSLMCSQDKSFFLRLRFYNYSHPLLLGCDVLYLRW